MGCACSGGGADGTPDVSGGGVLMDNGPHSVDIARCLLGPIERVHALAAPPIQDLGVEDTARLHFLTRAGAFGSVDLSWSVDKAGEDYVKVYGTGGTLLLGWQSSRSRKTGDSEWTRFGSGYQKATAFADLISNFVGVILGTASPRIEMEDALASVEVIEAAYRSLAQDTWASVGEQP